MSVNNRVIEYLVDNYSNMLMDIETGINPAGIKFVLETERLEDDQEVIKKLGFYLGTILHIRKEELRKEELKNERENKLNTRHR